MPNALTLTQNTIQKFSQLADLLEKTGKTMREAVDKAKRPSDSFWSDVDELQAAFSDLNESEIEELINQSVQTVRKEQTIIKKQREIRS